MKKATALGLLVGGVVACTDVPTSITSRVSQTPTRRVGVMTQNLYVGTDVDAVLAALMTSDPGDDVPALFAAIETLEKTDFPTRAGAIADEIARERPHWWGSRRSRRSTSISTASGLGW